MNTTFVFAIAILFICHVSAQDLLQGQKVYYKDPRTRIENRRYEIPMHMQRKANLHQQKALLEHDTIQENLRSIKLNAATTLTRNGRTTNNFVCNDDTQMSDAGYKCKNMDQMSFLSNAELGTEGSDKCGFDYINDIWGWTSPVTQKQYALVGMWDGTSFVDITDPSNPIVLGFLETAGDFDKDDCGSNFWRDVKVVNDYAYVGAEVDGHGIQSFNLKRLDLLARPLVTSEPLTRSDIPRLKADSHIDSIENSHNLISFEEMGQLLVVGFDKSDACSIKDGETVAVISSGELECLDLGGLINEGNKQPFAMGNSYAGYVHDGQCFIYNGPDLKYKDIPICIFFAETEIGIYDMKNRKMISTFSYDGATYVHQGWVSTDHTTLYANDENDEECRSGELDQCRDLEDDYAYPMTRIFDISSLENIGTPREFVNTNVHSSIDHNMYVQGDYLYSANYEAGARIYKILEDKSLEEVAYFDVSNDCEDIVNCEDPYGGVWTHYPFKRSTTTIASNGFYGLHILKTRLPFEPVSLDSLFD